MTKPGGYTEGLIMRSLKPGDYWFGDPSNQRDNVNSLLGLGRIGFHPESQRSFLNPDPVIGSANRFYTVFYMSPNVAQALGYAETEILLSNHPRNIIFAPYIARIIPQDTVYVYTSVIRNILVSNYEVKLLRVVPISHKNPDFGDNIFLEFRNPHFVTLNTSRLTCLDFEIRDITGNLVDFENGPKPVRLTLKIRQCKK